MPKLASGRKVAAPTDTWSEPMVRRLDEAGLDGGATLNEEAGRASSAPRFSYRARRRRLLRWLRPMSPVLSLAPGLSWDQPLLGERRQSVSVHPYSKSAGISWIGGRRAPLLAIAVS